MDDAPRRLTFHAEGSTRLGGHILAETVLEMLRAVVSALEINAKDAARDMKREVEWIVADVRNGSLDFDITSLPSDSSLRLVANHAVQAVARQTTPQCWGVRRLIMALNVQ